METLSPMFLRFRGWTSSCIDRKKKTVCSLLLAASAVLPACSVKTTSQAPDVSASKKRDIVAPPGMVYIPSGSISYRSSADKETSVRKLSLSPFFIDATEVTNRQFRMFVDWVADSIAVTDYLKDDAYFIKSKKSKGTSVGKRIDWGKVKSPLWKSSDPEIQAKLQGLVIEEGDRRVLNKAVVKYKYGYISAPKDNARKFVTEVVSVIPESSVWVTDFPNSQMSFMATNYDRHRAYDNHPVVGVTWKQARAYAYWRSTVSSPLSPKYKESYQSTFSLPTEAQWQYAAAGIRNPSDQVENALMTVRDRRSNNDKLIVNFKQEEGDYVEDGSIFTLPVKSYMPNRFGVFNMAGNVAEWTLDAFSPSASEFVHDLNPVLLYDAGDNESLVMKRKVVRGGSWKDHADLLKVDTRGYEIQDVAHSYIGFRCVMPAPEPLSEQVKTRSKLPVDEKPRSQKSDAKRKSSAQERLSKN